MNDLTQAVVEQNIEVKTDVDPEAKITNVISSQNPNEEEMKALMENISVNHNFAVEVKPVLFGFKKTTDKATNIETTREAVQLAIPYPSVQGLVDIMGSDDKKELELLMECMEKLINDTARSMISDDLSLNASNFPVEKISWSAIANTPKAQRKGRGIAKEIWEAFAQDYVEVMPAVTGKELDKVTNAAKVFLGKLQSARTNPVVLVLLQEQLGIYADNSENAEEFEDCIVFLHDRITTYLGVSDEDLTKNL